MATHSSILAWRISWTEEPDELQSMGSQRVGYDLAHSILRVFADVMKVRLKMRLYRIMWGPQSNDRCPYKRQKRMAQRQKRKAL